MIRSCILLATVSIGGCAASDPYLRSDVWYPKGVNAGNIAAMASQPHDLIKGRGATISDTHQGAKAVDLIWQGHPKPLPDATGAAQAPAAAPPPGGQN